MSNALRSPTIRRSVLGVVARRQTYSNLLYLLTAFPVGLAYFTFLVSGLATSASLLVVWVGIPLLFLMVVAWWGLGSFERELAMWWLGIDIPPMALARPAGGDLFSWPRLKAHLSNPVTWKSLLFLLAKFPLGLCAFIVSLMLITTSIGLIGAPLAYAIALGEGMPFDAVGLLVALGISLTGVVVGIATLHVLNGLAWLSGRFARAMLGMSASEMRVAEARAVAALAQAQAARADQSRKELIVNVSHELRTPIASIRGHVDSLLMTAESAGATDPTDQRAYLEIVAREAERLGALVDDLLALARADSGELKLTLGPVDVASVVEEVAAALAPLAKRERQVTLVREIAEALPPAWADRQRLLQVLLNLARNAITYTPAGGIVSIELQRGDGARLALSVADTGIGIAPEDLPHVFERFFRTDASRARASGGFGLGLAIVRDLVQAMGGSIAVTSQAGQGSRFTVTLPSATPNPQ